MTDKPEVERPWERVALHAGCSRFTPEQLPEFAFGSIRLGCSESALDPLRIVGVHGDRNWYRCERRAAGCRAVPQRKAVSCHEQRERLGVVGGTSADAQP